MGRFTRRSHGSKLAHRTRGRRLLVEQLEDRLTLSVTWTGNAGTFNWTDANNWSSHAVPGSTDDVMINVAVSSPISISSGRRPSTH